MQQKKLADKARGAWDGSSSPEEIKKGANKWEWVNEIVYKELEDQRKKSRLEGEKLKKTLCTGAQGP